ncbi:MAG TPA: glycosyltransferase family 39 protein [Bryobacteraceae bacterium]|nr:glycosyltransferase family 39 protein [Bryobacteraceae bacterium]
MQRRFTSASAIVLYIAAGKLIFHLLTASRYGIFRDELYYLACAEHLAWGYVDQPPLIAGVAWLARHAFGDSLIGLRLLPAIAGAAVVWLAGILAREMGGGRFAQALAALAVATAPLYLIFHHWLTMNAFDPLIWMGCAWFVLRAINSGDPRYWLGFGALTGVGLENKYAIAVFVCGVVVGLLLTPNRRFLFTRWFWLGAAAALVIFLPNLIWLAAHHFPFLELLRNVRASGRDVVRAPVAFLADQAFIMNPISFPLWAGGLVWLIASHKGRRFAVLGWTFVAVMTLFIALHGKNYYVAPVYPMMFAAGAVGFEQMTEPRAGWLRAASVVLILVSASALAPLVSPLLSPEAYLRYQKAIGLAPPEAEHQPTGPLPQYFADEFGWEQMVREVARVYHSLAPDERARAAIFANNYGEAGAIDFYGPRYGLPKAISVHQNYWFWGPRDYTGDLVIILGSNGRGDRQHFESVEAVGRVENPYSKLDERYDIFLCRNLKVPFREGWPALKRWR